MKNKILNVTKGLILSTIFASFLCLSFGETITAISENSVNTNTEITYGITDYIGIESAFAEEGEGEGEATAESNFVEVENAFDSSDIVKKIADLSEFGMRMFHPLINFFAFKIGHFLGNDYIYAGPMGIMLKKIWTVARNLVNIVFVLILLGIALKEIFWVSEESSDLKKLLIKFTLLLIAVNFSWMGSKVVLDAANVATNVAFSIPMGVSGVGVPVEPVECEVVDGKPEGMCKPTSMFIPVDAKSINHKMTSDCGDVQTGYDETYKEETGAEGKKILKADKTKTDYYQKATYCWDNIDFISYNKNTAVIYLTYGMARITNLIDASNSQDSRGQLAVGILFALLFLLAFVLVLMALFIAMVIRMAALWVFVAFSPFLVLMMFSEKFNIGESFSLKEFATWAFVPAGVGAVLSIAFVMISAGQSATEKTKDYFSQFNQAGELTSEGGLIKIDSLFAGMGSLDEFIWLLVTLIILWVGVFAVLSKSKYIGKVTDKISEFGSNIAGSVARAPLWAPILPMTDPKTGETKMTSFNASGLRLDRRLQEMEQKWSSTQDVSKLQSKINKMSKEKIERINNVKSPIDALAVANMLTSETGHNGKELIEKESELRTMLTNRGANKEQLDKVIDELRKIANVKPATPAPAAPAAPGTPAAPAAPAPVVLPATTNPPGTVPAPGPAPATPPAATPPAGGGTTSP